jgi:FtsH-binding integral membrane protein
MSTLFGEPMSHDGKSSVVDDFMYGSNVASSHIYVRLGFLRKVYGILSAQLLFTTVVGATFVVYEPLGAFVKANDWLVLVFAVLSIGLIIGMTVMRNVVPHNYILLMLFTMCESFLVGTVVSRYEVASVMEAFGLTCAVTTALTMYTCQTKRDFSSWGAGLFAGLWVLILAGFLQVFVQGEVFARGLGAVGAILFSLYIIYDTQQIMTRVSPEEYIHAATILYLDILNLFLHILRALGRSRD